MKLKEFKIIIDSAVEYAGDTNPDIQCILSTKTKEKEYDIDEVTQFGVIPNVTIHIGKSKINSWNRRIKSWKL